MDKQFCDYCGKELNEQALGSKARLWHGYNWQIFGLRLPEGFPDRNDGGRVDLTVVYTNQGGHADCCPDCLILLLQEAKTKESGA